MANPVDCHLDTNRNLVIVLGKGGPLEASKDLALVASTKIVASDLGDELVVRHGHHVDDD